MQFGFGSKWRSQDLNLDRCQRPPSQPLCKECSTVEYKTIEGATYLTVKVVDPVY